MFLSKIFGIFKKKNKDQAPANPSTGGSPSSGPVMPAEGLGAAVGVSQPDQSTPPPSPDSTEVAQAPSEPSFDTTASAQDSFSQPGGEDSSASQDEPASNDLGTDIPAPPVVEDPDSTPPQPDAGNDNPESNPLAGSGEDGSVAGTGVSPAPSDDSVNVVAPPADSAGDDNQNIAV